MSRRRAHSKGTWPSPKAGPEVRGRSELCNHGKMLYPSRAAAHAAAVRIRKDDPAGARLRPYPCGDVAGRWHIGLRPADVVAGAPSTHRPQE